MALKRKEESLAIMKDVLGNPANFKNFTVWHVYGLVYRQNKQYTEAKMAFKQALNLDEAN